MAATVLIIDDDPHFARILKDVLILDELAVHHALTAEDGFKILRKGGIDLLILDVDLPGMSGVQLLKKLREKDSGLSELLIMMLTVKGGEPHKLKGLDTGADDYVVKDASLQEVQARVRALLRRTAKKRDQGSMRAGALVLDIAAHEVRVNDERIPLTQSEFDLLSALIRRPGTLLTYEVLGESLTASKEGTSSLVYVHINSLRKKLGRHGAMIENVRGLGYKLVPS